MNEGQITAPEIWRLFMLLGGALMGLNALMIGASTMFGRRRSTKLDDVEEGQRREQLRRLLELAHINEKRWERHDKITDERVEQFRQTQATVGQLAAGQARLTEDVKGALAAATAAGEAITDLATGLAVRVSFGNKNKTIEGGTT